METNHVNAVAREILNVLKLSSTLLMSWGAIEFKAAAYNNMAALKFTVNGFLFAGDVIVALNEGDDYYEVYCIDDNQIVIKSREGVCFDELAGVIDRMVEKDCSQQEYSTKIKEWFNKTA